MYIYQVWSCLPQPFLRYYEKELISCLIKVNGQGQRLRSQIIVTSICVRISSLKLYAQTVYDPCDLEWPLTFTLKLNLKKNELGIREALKNTYTKYELVWLTRSQDIDQWKSGYQIVDRRTNGRTDGQTDKHDGIRSFRISSDDLKMLLKSVGLTKENNVANVLRWSRAYEHLPSVRL